MNMHMDRGADTGTTGHKETFLERLTGKLGSNAHAATVFAEPVERNGVTIIPVARARWGFGGGSAPAEGETQQEAAGGGGGLMISPVGYIELKDGKTTFHPIFDFAMILQLLIGSGIVAAIVLRGVRRIVRPRK